MLYSTEMIEYRYIFSTNDGLVVAWTQSALMDVNSSTCNISELL